MNENRLDIPINIHTPTSERKSGQRIDPDHLVLELVFYIPTRDFDGIPYYSNNFIFDQDNSNMSYALNRSLRDNELRKNNNIIVNLKPILNETETDCSICFEKIKLNEKVFDLTCKHAFHEECLSNWIKYKQDCPVCRKTISCKTKKRSIL